MRVTKCAYDRATVQVLLRKSTPLPSTSAHNLLSREQTILFSPLFLGQQGKCLQQVKLEHPTNLRYDDVTIQSSLCGFNVFTLTF